MSDEKEFLTAFATGKQDGFIAPIPFSVTLQQVDPHWTDNRDLPASEDDFSALYEGAEELDSKVSTLTSHEFLKWRRAVLFVSVVSVILQVTISIDAIIEGLKVDSSGTFAFGVETMLDVATTLIVIWRFCGVNGEQNSERRELKAVVCLSVLMAVFSVAVIVKAIYSLTVEAKPFAELKLMIICNIGFASFAILSWCKLIVGQRIKSKAVIMDAVSTFCATGMAIALLLSLMVYHYTGLWFLDSIVAIVISLLMFTYSVHMMYKIFKRRRKTF